VDDAQPSGGSSGLDQGLDHADGRRMRTIVADAEARDADRAMDAGPAAERDENGPADEGRVHLAPAARMANDPELAREKIAKALLSRALFDDGLLLGQRVGQAPALVGIWRLGLAAGACCASRGNVRLRKLMSTPPLGDVSVKPSSLRRPAAKIAGADNTFLSVGE